MLGLHGLAQTVHSAVTGDKQYYIFRTCKNTILFSSILCSHQDQDICQHNMTTGHGVPCAEKEQKGFCMNGGICYSIGPNQLCKCINNYTGERCENILLASVERDPKSDFSINFIVLAFFLGLLFLGFIYFCCRRKIKNRSEEGP